MENNPPSDIAPWRALPGFQALEAAFAGAGAVLHYVGGAVRDQWLGRAIDDVDAATPASPQEVQTLLAAAGIRCIPTGLAHGTVTALLPQTDGGRKVEITTFRADAACDGRHAQVSFGADIRTDAARRDFTINALYLGMDGVLRDPTREGMADIAAHRLRFIGDAAARIAEDALRILRYYRFSAQLEWEDWDEPARAACRAGARTIGNLSGERIAQEMRKLLLTPRPARALEAMRADGVLEPCLPGITGFADLDGAAAAEQAVGMPADVWLRLAHLLPQSQDADGITARWRLSRAEAAALLWLTGQARDMPEMDMASLKRLARRRGKEDARRLLAMAVLQRRLDPAEAATHARALRDWPIPEFPLDGRDLMALGYEAGPDMGRRLAALEAYWEESGYTATRAILLARAREERHD